MKKTVHSVIEKVTVREFKENRKTLLARHFVPSEIEELHTRSDKTASGLLAVKKALVLLCKNISPQSSFTEQSFQLSHELNGAPCIIAFPQISTGSKKIPNEDFYISITHNRSNAYGLAAFQEKGNE